MFGRRLDEDRNLAHPEIDRTDPLRFGETEEWPGHQVLRATCGNISAMGHEQFKLRRLGWEGGQASHCAAHRRTRSEEHTAELQSLMRTSYAVYCVKKQTR